MHPHLLTKRKVNSIRTFLLYQRWPSSDLHTNNISQAIGTRRSEHWRKCAVKPIEHHYKQTFLNVPDIPSSGIENRTRELIQIWAFNIGLAFVFEWNRLYSIELRATWSALWYLWMMYINFSNGHSDKWGRTWCECPLVDLLLTDHMILESLILYGYTRIGWHYF